MAELDKSKQAHVSTFMFMRIHGQSIRPFDSDATSPGMGLQKVRELTYFNGAGSQDMLKVVAAQIAHMMIVYINTYYTQQRESGYENTTIPDLVTLVAGVLVNPDKTVHDVSTTVDKVFRFDNEGTAAIPVAATAGDQPLSSSVKKKLKKIGIK